MKFKLALECAATFAVVRINLSFSHLTKRSSPPRRPHSKLICLLFLSKGVGERRGEQYFIAIIFNDGEFIRAC
jgi:hypothetical protein